MSILSENEHKLTLKYCMLRPSMTISLRLPPRSSVCSLDYWSIGHFVSWSILQFVISSARQFILSFRPYQFDGLLFVRLFARLSVHSPFIQFLFPVSCFPFLFLSHGLVCVHVQCPNMWRDRPAQRPSAIHLVTATAAQHPSCTSGWLTMGDDVVTEDAGAAAASQRTTNLRFIIQLRYIMGAGAPS